MTVDQFIQLLVTITLVEMMVAIGLGVRVSELREVARDWRLAARALLANYLCVPAATVGLLVAFQADPLVAAGFLVLAACPGAPYGPPFTAVARGNVAVAIGLMVILAGTSAIVAPLLLFCLLPLVMESAAITIDAGRIVLTLLLTQLLPLCVGLAVRQVRPAWAQVLLRPANLLSKVLNLLAVSVILVVQFPQLAAIRPRGLGGMLLLLAASWTVGWLLAGGNRGIRTTMMLTTSLRNVSVGLVIATGAFAGTAAVSAVAAYGLVSLLGTLALALFLRRLGLNPPDAPPIEGHT